MTRTITIGNSNTQQNKEKFHAEIPVFILLKKEIDERKKEDCVR